MKERQNWIGTLRGIAVLLVFLSHLDIPADITLAKAIQFILGRCGVVIFFLIMGYLAIEARKKRNGRQYLFNRFIRIYPIFWLLVTLYFVLMHLCYADYSVGIRSWLLNLTLFNEFFMVDCIISASWMLPMQVVFFVVLAVFNTRIFEEKIKLFRLHINACTAIIGLLMLLACITGYIRYASGIPFPTAFFLLLAVGVLGVSIKIRRGGVQAQLVLFEIGLFISVVLSYSNEVIQYLAAYNAGLVLFIVCEAKRSFHIKAFDDLGKIGFTCFLGAKIPMIILTRLIDCLSSVPLLLLEFALEFSLCIIFAAAVTRWIEKPMLSWAKRKESALA